VVLMLPTAGWLARQRPATAALLTAGYVACGLWVGAWILTGWPQSI
jgi:hypothetical protein